MPVIGKCHLLRIVLVSVSNMYKFILYFYDYDHAYLYIIVFCVMTSMYYVYQQDRATHMEILTT